MAKLGDVTFTAKSGKKYAFGAYPLNSVWNEVACVYIVTRRYKKADDSWTHETIYFGETGNLKERFQKHDKEDCFEKYNANCLCIHTTNVSRKDRVAIQDDLKDGYTKKPCND